MKSPAGKTNMVNVLKRLKAEILSLKQVNCQQATQIESKDAEIFELKVQVNLLQEKNSQLEAKNTALERELTLRGTKKNSNNSSIAPSQDPHRIKRTESLRERSGLKQGGQPGHAGSCLQMVENPTEIVIHQPGNCQCCGNDLSEVSAKFIGKHQVFDIPPVTPVIIEHQIYSKRCQCGHITESQYPAEAHSPVCYGPRIQGLTAYLHTRQYIAYERMCEFYECIFGLSISSGSLVNMVTGFADKSKGVYEEIRNRVSTSWVVGADETGVNINGKNCWAWTFNTPKLTYIHADLSRSKDVIKKLFANDFPKSILVHDCYTSYFSVQAQGHQICIAHLLRDLKYLGKLYKEQQWSQEFTDLLIRALYLKETLTMKYYPKELEQRSILEEQADEMLAQTTDIEHKKLTTFKERMLKYRKHLFTFLYHADVPPDNNASERAIRTFKVKQKVSGLFRAEEGAKAFAVIRSVIDTTIKNGKNVWEALALIATTPVPVKYQDSS